MTSRPFVISRATADEAGIIARHRADMYRDMGQLPDGTDALLVDVTTHVLREAMAAGEYVGWLASSTDGAGAIVGGGGALLRRRLPRVIATPTPHLAVGREALIVNVFVEPAWRRQGIARAILQEIVSWAVAEQFDSIVLHASEEGRALYESMGFRATNEMRYAGAIEAGPSSPLVAGSP
jgi:GNAT superfamily N-acetyltransferase